jgi:hypothetical protein
MPTEEFELGDEVSWTSQANGSAREKQGVVVYKGPPALYIPRFNNEHWISEEEFDAVREMRGRHRFDNCTEGVIVRVDRVHRVTKQALVPWYYAPRRKHLVVVRRHSSA